MTRILNRQRQLAEQGRLRLGYTVAAKRRDGSDTTRPVRSETWVITSHSREHVEHAAGLWGGEAHEWEPMGNGAKQWRVISQAGAIPAILPPGDPLTQAYEQWNRGGCVRRCDGVTEELSGSPCICIAQHGEQWYELGAREVCSSKSRLKVLLPDMPGLGSWRMETGSFYATDEIAGMVDTIRGAVGDSVLVPVTLRIEPRTRVAGGETKQFVVPVVELRGVTAGALLSGQAIETGALRSANLNSTQPAALQAAPRQAIGAGAPPEQDLAPYYADLERAATGAEVLEVFDRAKAAGILGGNVPATHPLYVAIGERGRALSAAEGSAPQGSADEPVDAVVVEEPTSEADPDMVWQLILATAGDLGADLGTVTRDFEQRMALAPGEASGGELQAYLQLLRTEGLDQAVPA